jgi:hypothetical protein
VPDSFFDAPLEIASAPKWISSGLAGVSVAVPAISGPSEWMSGASE